MDIEQLYTAKRALEKQIADHLANFSKETGLVVDSIEIDNNSINYIGEGGIREFICMVKVKIFID